jgi:IPT/TIG domain-containing protein
MALVITDPKFQAFMSTCPRAWAGDTGFSNWYTNLYNMGQNLPTISSLSPSTIAHGAADTTVTVTGTNYIQGAAAFSGATQLATTYLSATSLSAVIPAALLASAGTLAITIQNPDSRASSSSNFTVT